MTSGRRIVARHWPAAALGAFVVVGGLITVVIWVPAKDGSKQAELASALISGLVVGVALLAVERAFTRSAANRNRESDVNAALRSTTRSDSPSDVSTPKASESVLAADLSPSDDGTKHRYQVAYEGSIRDTSRIDAQQLRLRVFRDGEYFQFVTVPVPGPFVAGRTQ